MEASSKPSSGEWLSAASRVDWGGVSAWLLGFGLVVYLGLKGGGFDPLVHDQVGIAVWWVLLATVAVGAIPRRRPATLAWAALGLLAAFVAWTAFSLIWTESAEATSAELARVAAYLGVFALAIFARRPKGARRMVGAIGAGIAVVVVVALLSRLHPAWFPAADQTAEFLSSGRERLSYPLNYWNGLAALIAIGLPLLLQVATGARHVALRALSAAAIPALILAALFTLSRGGIAAAFLAVAVFIALTSDRLPKLLTVLVTGAGGAILLAAAEQRDELRHGLANATAHQQGNDLLVWTIIVCLVVAAVQAAISVALERDMRPRWTRVSRRHSLAALGIGIVVAVIAAIAIGAPGKASNAWDEFKRPEVPGKGTERLSKASGESRYQFWSSAVREAETKPLTGTGSGTFEFWWTRDGDTSDVVDNAHSLYMETLGELGIVGLALLLAFFATVLVGGSIAALRAGDLRAPPLAAAVAGCVAFCFTAAFDWMWQLPVLPIATLLLAAVLVTHAVGASASRRKRGPFPFAAPGRVAIAIVSLAAIVAIAIPLASTSLVRQSQDEAQAGNLAAALDDARSAENVQPGAATPRLQQALVLETEGELAAAAEAARAATGRGSTNWRLWMVRSRIEAQLGNAEAAIRFYRKAHSLNPNSPLFSQ
jgi:hypothetical protein